jgi:hypothetical protein
MQVPVRAQPAIWGAVAAMIVGFVWGALGNWAISEKNAGLAANTAGAVSGASGP